MYVWVHLEEEKGEMIRSLNIDTVKIIRGSA